MFVTVNSIEHIRTEARIRVSRKLNVRDDTQQLLKRGRHAVFITVGTYV